MVAYLVCRTTRHVHPSSTPHRSSSLYMNQREAISTILALFCDVIVVAHNSCWLCQPRQKARESICWKHPAVRHWAGQTPVHPAEFLLHSIKTRVKGYFLIMFCTKTKGFILDSHINNLSVSIWCWQFSWHIRSPVFRKTDLIRFNLISHN